MDVKRGTLAVVCLATAVLMLDIAVVNTALPHIASDLNASLSGIQWVGLHHPRKQGNDGSKRVNSLDDIYGSGWLTKGTGSVVSLWGDAGDRVVELLHLKQPADTVGPLTVLTTGTAVGVLLGVVAVAQLGVALRRALGE